MGLFDRLFGRKDNNTALGIRERFYESDNLGLRFDSYEQAESYWINRNISKKFEPFIISNFGDEEKAKKALISLDCMHIAEDSGKIICTKTIYYGYFRDLDGNYNAIICGSDLSHGLWSEAKNNFSKFGGTVKNEQEPEQDQGNAQEDVNELIKKVQFVREDRIPGIGGIAIYRIYKGPDAMSAKSFLENEPVMKNLYYVVVETPEGNYCRDIQGMYKE